jgi:hypothetical protein
MSLFTDYVPFPPPPPCPQSSMELVMPGGGMVRFTRQNNTINIKVETDWPETTSGGRLEYTQVQSLLLWLMENYWELEVEGETKTL